jgi:hypothetical protein
MLGSLLRLAVHHKFSRKIDSTFMLPLFQGSNRFGAIGELAVARINCVQDDRPDVLISHRIKSGTAPIAYYLSAHPQAESG